MRLFWSVMAIALAALVVGAFAAGSWLGVLSSVIGVAGTTVYLWATWLLTRLVGSASSGEKLNTFQVVLTATAVVAKLPLIYGGWALCQTLGPFGPTWFLLGLALVYCGLIWRAVLTVRD